MVALFLFKNGVNFGLYLGPFSLDDDHFTLQVLALLDLLQFLRILIVTHDVAQINVFLLTDFTQALVKLLQISALNRLLVVHSIETYNLFLVFTFTLFVLFPKFYNI